MNLNLEKLSISQELFKPYGDIISKGMENKKYIINQGYCERFDEVAPVNLLDKKAKPIISIFSAIPRKRPINAWLFSGQWLAPDARNSASRFLHRVSV